MAVRVSLHFEPRDLWVGLFWRDDTRYYPDDRAVPWVWRKRTQYTFFVCLVPCLPLVIEWIVRDAVTTDPFARRLAAAMTHREGDAGGLTVRAEED